MLDDLDRTIEALLRHELPAELVSQIAITFSPPDDQFPPQAVTLPALDVFLFGIRENRDLRAPEPVVDRGADGVVVRRRSPIRVACTYLVTAWASESSTTPALDEHRLLGEAMRALLRHSTIPEPVLQGSLAAQEPPLPTLMIEPDLPQSHVDLWHALKGKVRAAFTYTVTIGVDALEPVAAGPPVIERRFRYRVDGEPVEE
jgi:Pvc16 N-terminal domain